MFGTLNYDSGVEVRLVYHPPLPVHAVTTQPRRVSVIMLS